MQAFFCLWQVCPSEGWAWSWHSCLGCGNPCGTKCAGTWTASSAGVMAQSESFFNPCSWWSEGLFGQSFSIVPPVQALRGPPGWGPILYIGRSGAWWASLSIVKLPMLACGKREAMVDGSTPYAWLSSIALLPWLPGFPPQAFPTTISSFTSPQSFSLQSTTVLTLGLLCNP